jgi:hypothetical protein
VRPCPATTSAFLFGLRCRRSRFLAGVAALQNLAQQPVANLLHRQQRKGEDEDGAYQDQEQGINSLTLDLPAEQSPGDDD